jgi:hypothetical protein
MLTYGQRSTPRVESLEARVQQMETLLDELSAQVKPNTGESDIAIHLIEAGDGIPRVLAKPDEEMPLPPLEETLPIVEHYFLTANRALPLFHQETFMRLLRDWYSAPVQRNAAPWAAINIVLALGQQHWYTNLPGRKVGQYVRNAQSALNELVTRDRDLLGIQVLLGLCTIFQSSPDPRPATVLIATAVRLSQRLRLYTRKTRHNFDAAEAMQRDRVFWITYILDRDISMRAVQPSLHADTSIDIELPGGLDPETGGVLTTQDGQSKFNFFRNRVRLAVIQGRIYDFLYSIRAEKLTSSERERNTQNLEDMLDQWYRGIQIEFMPESLPRTVAPWTLRYFISLHWTHLQCLALIQRSNAHSSHWVRTIHAYCAVAIQESGTGVENMPPPPLPRSWGKIIEGSRACMRLSNYLACDDTALMW